MGPRTTAKISALRFAASLASLSFAYRVLNLGMPVAFLLKLIGTIGLPGFRWLDHDVPAVDPRQVAYIGLRDLDDGERVTLRWHLGQGMTEL